MAKKWHLIIDGYKISEDELTLGDLVRVDELSGVTWASINPAQNPKTLLAWVRVALERQNIDPERAQVMAERLSSRELADAVQLLDDGEETAEPGDGASSEGDADAETPKAPASSPTVG